MGLGIIRRRLAAASAAAFHAAKTALFEAIVRYQYHARLLAQHDLGGLKSAETLTSWDGLCRRTPAYFESPAQRRRVGLVKLDRCESFAEPIGFKATMIVQRGVQVALYDALEVAAESG